MIRMRCSREFKTEALAEKVGVPVEYATLEWVDWFNHRRLLRPIGNMPPAMFEQATMTNGKSQPGWLDLHTRVSGEPGVVPSAWCSPAPSCTRALSTARRRHSCCRYRLAGKPGRALVGLSTHAID